MDIVLVYALPSICPYIPVCVRSTVFPRWLQWRCVPAGKVATTNGWQEESLQPAE